MALRLWIGSLKLCRQSSLAHASRSIDRTIGGSKATRSFALTNAIENHLQEGGRLFRLRVHSPISPDPCFCFLPDTPAAPLRMPVGPRTVLLDPARAPVLVVLH